MGLWMLWMLPFYFFMWLSYKHRDNTHVWVACIIAALICFFIAMAS